MTAQPWVVSSRPACAATGRIAREHLFGAILCFESRKVN